MPEQGIREFNVKDFLDIPVDTGTIQSEQYIIDAPKQKKPFNVQNFLNIKGFTDSAGEDVDVNTQHPLFTNKDRLIMKNLSPDREAARKFITDKKDSNGKQLFVVKGNFGDGYDFAIKTVEESKDHNMPWKVIDPDNKDGIEALKEFGTDFADILFELGQAGVDLGVGFGSGLAAPFALGAVSAGQEAFRQQLFKWIVDNSAPFNKSGIAISGGLGAIAPFAGKGLAIGAKKGFKAISDVGKTVSESPLGQRIIKPVTETIGTSTSKVKEAFVPGQIIKKPLSILESGLESNKIKIETKNLRQKFKDIVVERGSELTGLSKDLIDSFIKDPYALESFAKKYKSKDPGQLVGQMSENLRSIFNEFFDTQDDLYESGLKKAFEKSPEFRINPKSFLEPIEKFLQTRRTGLDESERSFFESILKAHERTGKGGIKEYIPMDLTEILAFKKQLQRKIYPKFGEKFDVSMNTGILKSVEGKILSSLPKVVNQLNKNYSEVLKIRGNLVKNIFGEDFSKTQGVLSNLTNLAKFKERKVLENFSKLIKKKTGQEYDFLNDAKLSKIVKEYNENADKWFSAETTGRSLKGLVASMVLSGASPHKALQIPFQIAALAVSSPRVYLGLIKAGLPIARGTENIVASAKLSTKAYHAAIDASDANTFIESLANDIQKLMENNKLIFDEEIENKNTTQPAALNRQ